MLDTASPIPVSIILMLSLFVVFFIVLRFTTWGRRIYLVGGNREASRIAGINTHRVTISAYMKAGMLSALAGCLIASRVSSAQVTIGTTYHMDAITAAAFGGIALHGGKGNLWGTLFGVIIISMLDNGLIMAGVPSFYQHICQGAILVLAVSIQTLATKKD